MRTPVALTLATIAISLAGCTSEPTVPPAELSEALQDVETVGGIAVPDDKADCVAQVYADSDLSQEYLDALLAGDPVTTVSEDDRETLADLAPDIAACL